MAEPLRVLFLSHGHPARRSGGAEIAAHALFSACRAAGVEAWFLACDDAPGGGRPGAAITQPAGREYLYRPGAFDWLRLANRDPRFPAEFARLLAELRPDVVHCHHYMHFGVEAFALVRRALPRARIILTLHEYLAICHHYGQMVTTGRALCDRAEPARCHACFPAHDPGEFHLRRAYIQRFMGCVDRFVAPSRFLAARYLDWGLPAGRVRVIENLLRPPAAGSAARGQDGAEEADGAGADGMLRLGFFGQISWLKGCNLLFDAAALLEREPATFEMYGDERGQPPEFQAEFRERLRGAGRNVAFHGPYDNASVGRLMRGVSAVLVPSVWWENSPLVIQEARRARRPVLCADLGGMAEKVRHGRDGLRFQAGSAAALAALVRRLLRDPGLLRGLSAAMAPPPSARSILARHLALYREKPGEPDREPAECAVP